MHKTVRWTKPCSVINVPPVTITKTNVSLKSRCNISLQQHLTCSVVVLSTIRTSYENEDVNQLHFGLQPLNVLFLEVECISNFWYQNILAYFVLLLKTLATFFVLTGEFADFTAVGELKYGCPVESTRILCSAESIIINSAAIDLGRRYAVIKHKGQERI